MTANPPPGAGELEEVLLEAGESDERVEEEVVDAELVGEEVPALLLGVAVLLRDIAAE